MFSGLFAHLVGQLTRGLKRKAGEAVAPLRVGASDESLPGVGVLQGNSRAGESVILRITDRSLDNRGIFRGRALPSRGREKQSQEHDYSTEEAKAYRERRGHTGTQHSAAQEEGLCPGVCAVMQG